MKTPPGTFSLLRRILTVLLLVLAQVAVWQPGRGADAAPQPQSRGSKAANLAPLSVPAPSVALNVPSQVFIGEDFTFTATFSNTGADPGYGPFIDLVFPVTGADGAGAAVDDGITFLGANYLGSAIPAAQIYQNTFPATDLGYGIGCLQHSIAVQPGGQPGNPELPLPHVVCGNPGDMLVTIVLPFGSFVPSQPPAAVTINAHLSNLADLGTPLNIRSQGGFQFGATPLNDFCCGIQDATIPTATSAYQTPGWPASPVTPALMTLSKSYIGPENETATGPNYPRQFQITVDVATGQTISNLVIHDALPGNIQFVSVDTVTPADTVGLRVLPSTATPGGDLSVTIPSVTGGAGATDARLIFTYYVDRAVAGTPIIPPTTGAQNTSSNTADTSGTWVPIDVRDQTPPPPLATAICAAPCVTIEDQSIVVQKSVTNTTDASNSPGDVLQYTLNFQVSDFFGFQNISLTDVLSDGQRFDATYTPRLVFTGNPSPARDFNGNFAPANYTIDNSDIGNDTNPATTGTQRITFNVSGQLGAQVLGGCVNPNIANNPPNCSTYNNAVTTGTITFRAVIQKNFSDTYLPNDPAVDHGDILNDNVTVTGEVLNIANAPVGGLFAGTTNYPTDNSSANLSIAFGGLLKSIYAVNGNTTIPAYLSPGDVVTYRLQYTQPNSNFETTTFTDFLPLPVFNSTELTTLNNTVCGTPAAGVLCLGPADTYHSLNSAPVNDPNPVVVPTFATNGTANSLSVTYSSYNSANNASSVVDLLFSVTVKNDPFADGLFLTNQANVSEGTTNAGVQKLDAIVQIQLGEPSLRTAKTAVSTDHTPVGDIVFTPNQAIYSQFSQPGGAGAPFSGVIGSNTLSSNPDNPAVAFDLFNGSLIGVDGGDLVKYALIVENKGHSQNGAYDIVVNDTLPVGMSIPTGALGLNLQIYRGDGTAFTFEVINFGGDGKLGGGDDTVLPGTPANAALIFNPGYGIRVVDPAGPSVPGACQVASLAGGANVIVFTYDLVVDSSNTPGQTLVNTGKLHGYAGTEGGPNFLPAPLQDTANVIIKNPVTAKALTSTEINTATNSNTQAVIGEIATYTLTTTLHEGVLPAASLVDTLDPGLAFVDLVSVKVSNPDTDGAAPGDNGVYSDVMTFDAGGNCTNCAAGTNPTVGANGSSLTFNLGTMTNTNIDNSVAETLTIVYRVIVTNVVSNQSGTLLNNAAQLTWTGGSLPAVSAGNVTVIEPSVSINKATVPAVIPTLDAGDPLTYQITLTGVTTDSFDVTFSDPLPQYFLPTGFTVASAPTAGIATAADFQIVGVVGAYTLQTTAAANIDLPVGETVTITLNGTIAYAAPPNSTLTNTGTVRWTSLNGNLIDRSTYTPDSDERTGADGVGGALNDYAAASTVVTNITNPLLLTKALVSTSEAHTIGTDVAIGEIARFRLTVRVPEGTSPNLQLQDRLPTGLTFLNDGTAKMAFVCTNTTPPCNATSSTIPGSSWITLNAIVGNVVPAYVLQDADISDNAATNTDNYVSGTDVFFKLGDLVNNANDPNDEYVVIEFNALVDNSLAGNNNNSNTRANDFIATVSGTQSGAASNSVTLTVREPNIPFNGVAGNQKTVVPTTNVDAGDTVTYTVTYTNTGAADAFEVRTLDTLNSTYFTLNLGSVSTNLTDPECAAVSPTVTNASAANTVDVTVSRVPVNCTVVITYTALSTINAAPSTTYTNTANITYSSLPGTGTMGNPTGSNIPGGSGASNGERNHDNAATGGANNDYRSSNTASTTNRLPTMTKTLFTTELNVPGNDNTQAVIGESVTYELVITVPEGITPNLQVVDTLDSGLAFVHCTSVTSSSVALSTSLGGFAAACNDGTVVGTNDPIITANGGVATFNFGTVTNTDTNNAIPETLTIHYTVVPLNILANQNAPATLLNNSAVLSWTGGSQAAVSANNVSVVEPALTITKTRTVTGADAGDTTTFQVVVTNGNAAADTVAYDAVFRDVIPVDLTYVAGSAATTVCTAGAPIFNYDGPTTTLTATWATFPKNTSCTFTFSTTINLSVYPAQAIGANTGEVRWTSISGTRTGYSPYTATPADSSERTGPAGAIGSDALNNYGAQSATANFNVTAVGRQKAIVATSEAHTTGANVAIGEIIRYRLVLQLPESTVPGFTLSDTFAGPAGVRYLNDGSAKALFVGTTAGAITSSTFATGPVPGLTLCSNPANANTYTLAQAADPTVILSSQVNCSIPDTNISNTEVSDTDAYPTNGPVRFRLGTITNNDNDANAEFIIVEFNALVTDEAANAAGNTVTNQFIGRRYNAGYVNMGTTAPGVVATVVEPNIPFSAVANNKTASPTTGVDAGDTVNYTITYTNTNTATAADAYEVIVTDNLAALPFTNVTYTNTTFTGCTAPGAVSTTGSTATSLVVTVPHVSVGCTVTITYSATATTAIAPSTSYTNTASITYTSLPGTNGTTGNTTGSNTPGTPGSTTGERDGSGGAINHYNGSDTAVVTSAAVTPVKSIMSTSEASTSEAGDGSNNTTNARSLAIGEVMRYRLAVELPEGTSTNFVITDTLPAGLTFIDGTIKLAYWADNNVTNVNGAANTDLAGANANPDANPPTFSLPVTYYTYNGGTRLLTINLQSPVNNDLNDGNAEYVVLEFNVYVNNDANNNNTTVHDNLFNVTINGGTAVPSNHIYSRVDEPVLLLDKVGNPPTNWHYGDTVTYTLSLTSAAASAATAFDLTITDTVPTGLTFTGFASTPAGWIASNVGPALTWTCNSPGCSVPVGGSATFTYTVTVDSPPAPTALTGNATVTNTAALTWTSLPGGQGTTTNPTGSSTPGTSGQPNGERNGSGTGSNDNLVSDTHTGGITAYYSLGNRVWFDTNNNSLIDAGEVGVNGVTVQLYAADVAGNPTGPVLATTTTVSNTAGTSAGYYLFDYLLPGDYVVVIPASNFTGVLKGYWSSATSLTAAGALTEVVAPDADTVATDSDDNGTRQTGGAFAGAVITQAVTLGPAGLTEPTGETDLKDGSQGAQPDGRANMTVDFGFYKTEIGNLVYEDVNANGNYDAGTDTPLGGVNVRLYDSTGTNEIPVGADGILGTADDAAGGIPTDAGGLYQFSGLPNGDYVIKATGPAGMISTRDDFNAADNANPDVNADNNDNGIGTATGQAASGQLTMAGSEVAANITVVNATGTTTDLTVDFGFVYPYALGNRVWFDTDNSGTINGTEAGIDGVTVQLYRADALGNPTGAVLAITTTASDATKAGYYLFDYLVPGNYVVVIPASNFTGAGRLVGYWSSLTSMQANGTITETAAPSPNNDLDSDDNGTRQTAGAFSGAVISQAVTLGLNGLTEPLNEADLHSVNGQGAQPDGRANMTVDFGFYKVEVGNQVFNDLNANGILDGTDTALAGATVRLYATDAAGNSPVAIMVTVTNAGGLYLFTGLPQGNYIVSATAPSGTASTQDVISSANPSTNVDGDDNGVGTGGGEVFAGVVTLTPGAAGVLGNNSVVNATGTTTNPTVDFGFVGQVAIGNRVWFDDGAGGGIANNGILDGGELGISGVTVQLFTSTGTFVATTTTDANGNYQFDQLYPGTYYVFVPATQFQPGGKLEGYASSVGNGTNETSDENVDENGIDNAAPATNGIRSMDYILLGGTEVTGENQSSYTGTLADANVNFTADFGFTAKYALGNRVWFDTNNNALLDAGETGIDGVTVELYNADAAGNATTSTGLVTTTAHGGYYLFDSLNAGKYVVVVQASNFGPGGVLESYWSSQTSLTPVGPGPETLAPSPDTDIDSDDNGTRNTVAGVLPVGAVASQAVTLGGVPPEPVGEADVDSAAPGVLHQGYPPDNRANMTVDFGFFSAYSLGNRVWFDTDNSSTINGSEVGVDGVTVDLYRDNGGGSYTFIGTTTTANGGYYLFNYLGPANYVVALPSSNFTGAGRLVGYWSSATTMQSNGTLAETVAPTPNANGPDGIAGTADDDVDSDDNGTLQTGGTFNGAVISGPVTLGPVGNTEPTGETDVDTTLPGSHQGQADGLANMKVDFGFYREAIGNLVFYDENKNGLFDVGETVLPGATVRLYATDAAGNSPVEVHVGPDGILGTADDATGGMLTNAGGLYLFTGLPQGNYIVSVNAPGGISTRDDGDAADSANPNQNVDSNDNGLGTGGGEVFANVLALTPGGAGVLGNNNVNNANGTTTNPTVDFGFIPVFSLGNRVWYDTDNNRAINGAEVGIDNVTVQLYAADAGGNPTGAALQTQTTTGGGYYLFNNLLAGDYVVVIPAANFTGVLNGYWSSGTTRNNDSSLAEVASPAANSDIDSDDNGMRDVSGGAFNNAVISKVVTLGPGGTEPTGETDINGGQGQPDAQANMTVDFGFYTIRVGDLIWNDANNNGLFDSATETGLQNVTVQLLSGDGLTVLGTTTTNASGAYAFTGLPEGNYLIRLPATDFNPGGVLRDYVSSTGSAVAPFPFEPAPAPDTVTTDSDDNGTETGGTLGLGGYIQSAAFALTPAAEQSASNANGSTTEFRVDFGVYVNAQTNLTITKNDGVIFYLPGGTLTYTITVTNNGPADANGALVSDTLQPQIVSWDWACTSQTGGATGCDPVTGSTTTFNDTVNLPQGAAITYTVTASIASAATGDLTNTVTVTPPVGVTETNPADNTASDMDVAAALTVTKDDGFTVVSPNTRVTYTINVRNTGGMALTNITVTDTLPAEVTYVSATPAPTTIAGGILTWNSISLPVGGSTTISLVVDINATAIGPIMLNTVEAVDAPTKTSATGTDTDVIAIDKTKVLINTEPNHDVNPNVYIGEVLTYQISVEVPANSALTALKAVDTMDSGLAFVRCVSVDPGPVGVLTTSLAGGFAAACNAPANPTVQAEPVGDPSLVNQGRRVTFDFGTVTNTTANIETLIVTYEAVVLDIPANVNGVTGLKNALTWNWTGGSLSASATPLSIQEPKLSIDKSATPTTTPLNTPITFTLDIAHTTASTADAYDVVVTDVLPDALAYVANSTQVTGLAPTTITYDTVTHTLRFAWDVFPLGQKATISYQAIFIGPAPATNTVSVIWSSLPIDPALNGQPVALSNFNIFAHERWYDPLNATGVDAYSAQSTVTINTPKNLPTTGFAPGRVTNLPPQPADKQYTSYSNMWLEIPSIGQTLPITGVPLTKDGWDLTWLSNQAGYLDGTTYPGQVGTTAITAHVTLADGTPGPFRNLDQLQWGNQVILHANGDRYVYEVRELRTILPGDFSVFKKDGYTWMTLLTCKEYVPWLGTYNYRYAVRAVLLKVEADPIAPRGETGSAR